MTTAHLVPADIVALYEVHEWRNAVGVLTTACPDQWADILAALRAFKLYRSEILIPGKNRSSIVERLERPLKDAGWVEKHFATAIVVDGEQRDSPTHSGYHQVSGPSPAAPQAAVRRSPIAVAGCRSPDAMLLDRIRRAGIR